MKTPNTIELIDTINSESAQVLGTLHLLRANLEGDGDTLADDVVLGAVLGAIAGIERIKTAVQS